VVSKDPKLSEQGPVGNRS